MFPLDELIKWWSCKLSSLPWVLRPKQSTTEMEECLTPESSVKCLKQIFLSLCEVSIFKDPVWWISSCAQLVLFPLSAEWLSTDLVSPEQFTFSSKHELAYYPGFHHGTKCTVLHDNCLAQDRTLRSHKLFDSSLISLTLVDFPGISEKGHALCAAMEGNSRNLFSLCTYGLLTHGLKHVAVRHVVYGLLWFHFRTTSINQYST